MAGQHRPPPGVAARARRRTATIPWRYLVWIIWAAVFWDAASLFIAGGSSAYRGVSYALLRHMPGGMRVYGILLGALLLAAVYSYGRSTASPRDTMLRVCLASMAAWYVGWTTAIVWAWLTHWQASGIGGLGRTVAFALVCLLTAWFTPHDRRRAG